MRAGGQLRNFRNSGGSAPVIAARIAPGRAERASGAGCHINIFEKFVAVRAMPWALEHVTAGKPANSCPDRTAIVNAATRAHI